MNNGKALRVWGIQAPNGFKEQVLGAWDVDAQEAPSNVLDAFLTLTRGFFIRS